MQRKCHTPLIGADSFRRRLRGHDFAQSEPGFLRVQVVDHLEDVLHKKIGLLIRVWDHPSVLKHDSHSAKQFFTYPFVAWSIVTAVLQVLPIDAVCMLSSDVPTDVQPSVTLFWVAANLFPDILCDTCKVKFLSFHAMPFATSRT